MDTTAPPGTPRARKQAFYKWMTRKGGVGCWGIYCWLADPERVRQERARKILIHGKSGDVRREETRVTPAGTDKRLAKRFYNYRLHCGVCTWEEWIAWVQGTGPKPVRPRIWGKERKTPEGTDIKTRNRFHAYKAAGGKKSFDDWLLMRKQKDLLIPKGTDPEVAERFRAFMKRNGLARFKDWHEWMMGRGKHPKDLPRVLELKKAPETNLRGLASRN